MASILPHSGVLGKRLAKHLLRRCTFNITKARIDDFATKQVHEAVDELFTFPALFRDEPKDPVTENYFNVQGGSTPNSTGNQRDNIRAWWVSEALHDTSIRHKMMLFLHQNFVVNKGDSGNPQDYFDYFSLLRFYAKGSYKELATKMTYSNSMLDYLDGHSNSKNSPNENYSREFFELFTIGKGEQVAAGDYTTYTEFDIVVAAKLLTGWRKSSRPVPADPTYADADTGINLGYAYFLNHNTEDKTFSHAFANQTITGAVNIPDMGRELDDFVNMVFDKDATAMNICRKLYRFFVKPNITAEVETDIITPMANTLKVNDYVIEPALKQLLNSLHFYDLDDSDNQDETIGGMLKSPLDYLLPIISFFEFPYPEPETDLNEYYNKTFNDLIIDYLCTNGDMRLFNPDSVAGYPAYYQEPGYDKNWITSGSIATRYSIPDLMLEGDLGFDIKYDVVDFIKNSGVISNPFQAHIIVDELGDYLFPEGLSAERREYFLNGVFLDGIPAYDWTSDWADFITTGMDNAVRPPLENLFRNLLFSQEFQCM